jgi:hypothetical protein
MYMSCLALFSSAAEIRLGHDQDLCHGDLAVDAGQVKWRQTGGIFGLC